MTVDFYEKVASRSPSSAGFALNGVSRAVMVFNKIAPSDLIDAIRELLGETREDPTTPHIIRKLPKRHPRFPWLWAERISDIRGEGQQTKTAPAIAGDSEGESFEWFSQYDYYTITVEFSQRPYLVLPDSEIGTGTLTYTPPDVSPHGSNTASTKTYAEEWLRFTDFEYAADGEYVTADKGRYKFDAPGVPGLNSTTLTGKVRQYMPYRTVLFRWYQVPESWMDINTGGITAGKGCVNQFQFKQWAAGHLLYRDVRILNRYTPPVPDIDLLFGTSVHSSQKLVDIEFIFSELAVDASDPPTAAATANVIQAGHNLAPYANRAGFYFMKTTGFPDAIHNGVPKYPSYPFEMIFTNPQFA